MVPMATFMKESGSSVIASRKRRCAGRRVSQWHKLCWSRAGVTLAGTTGQLSLLRIFHGPTSSPCLPPAPAYLLLLFLSFFSFFLFLFLFSTTLACHVGGYPASPQCQVLSRGESTPQVSALVRCTLQTALKPEGYITLLM